MKAVGGGMPPLILVIDSFRDGDILRPSAITMNLIGFAIITKTAWREAVTTRREFLRLGAAFAALAVPQPVSAQKWPVRPIRAIVPASAGSSIDIIARNVAEPLAAALGQNIVIENRGGAGGTIGSAVVAKAEPDGHTILIHSSAHSAAPAAYPRAPFHASRDLAGVVIFGTVPNVTVISPAKGIKTLKELVDAAKNRSLTFASVGIGSATHWAVERLRPRDSTWSTSRSRAGRKP